MGFPDFLTERDNMDPKGVRTDAELNDALRLIQKSHGASTSLREKFQLEASVLSDGSNFSAGEKQLRKYCPQDVTNADPC